MSERREIPDFFLLGAAKCGTTSVYAWLEQHPQVCMSRPKEPDFFSGGFELGQDWYRRRYFAHHRDERLLGDASHRNLYHAHVPERVHAVCPGARLVVLLRDPVERALAHWWTEYRRGREWLSFDEAVAADLVRLRHGIPAVPRPELIDGRPPSRRLLRALAVHRSYVDSGHYADQLERWLVRFAPGRLRVFRFDALRADPRAVARELFEFLGVDTAPAATIDVSPRRPAGRLKPSLRRPGQLLRQWTTRRAAGAPTGPRDLLERPPLRPATRAALEAHYAPHQERLERLLAKHWPG